MELDERNLGVALIQVFLALEKVTDALKVSKAMAQAITFAGRNLAHLMDDESTFKDVKIKPDNLELLTRAVIILFWSVLVVGRQINSWRAVMGRSQVNWYEEATRHDQEQTTS